MRASTKVFLAALILSVLCIATIFSHTGTPTVGASTTLAPSIQTSTAQESTNPGRPAIQPSLSMVATLRITSTDVRSYLSTHPFPGGPVINGTTATIASLQFITSKEASHLMNGEETGLPDTAMVCYVKLHGPFNLVAVHLPPHATKLPTATYVVEIFDAQTGNFLMWWTPLT